MMNRPTKLLIAILIPSLLLGLLFFVVRRDDTLVEAQLLAPAENPAGFTQAKGPRPLQFPSDHGPHPDFQTEWWYYTGNLETTTGRRFGYQLTFFRRALTPSSDRPERPSDWATQQVYMAHFALTDVDGQQHQAFERFSRGAAGLAGAQANPFQVWLEDWQIEEVQPRIYRMYTSQEGLTLDLLLRDDKGPILHGDRGYSQKGPEPGNASYYYSLTRMETSGTIQLPGMAFEVRGLSWMDHEFSTSALSPGQVGWDWFSLQLDDGSELMVFQIRREDGGIDPRSSGTFVATDGSSRNLTRNDFAIQVEATWRSPNSRARYPAQWKIVVPSLDLDLRIEPYLEDQELQVSYTYWEGAVQLEGVRSSTPVRGSGYIEMTGYAGSMQGQF
jgi:predicted secreted hydrolase